MDWHATAAGTTALDELLSAVERDALRQRCRDLEVLAGVLADPAESADRSAELAEEPPPPRRRMTRTWT